MPDFMSGAMFHAILAWPTNRELRSFHRVSDELMAGTLRLSKPASSGARDELDQYWPQHDWRRIEALSAKRRVAMGGIEKRLRHRMIAAKIGIGLIHLELFGTQVTLPPSLVSLSIDQLSAFVSRETTIDDPENVEKLVWRTSLPIIHLAIATQLILHRNGYQQVNEMDLHDHEFYRTAVLLAQQIELIIISHPKINITADRLTQVRWYD